MNATILNQQKQQYEEQLSQWRTNKIRYFLIYPLLFIAYYRLRLAWVNWKLKTAEKVNPESNRVVVEDVPNHDVSNEATDYTAPASEQTYSPIESLPKDLVQQIAFDYLPRSDAGHLSQTSKFFSTKIQPRLLGQAVIKLVQHVVLGEKNQVEEMLSANPEYLLLRATVEDYSGRTIENATAFEAALGAGDADMAQMIAPYFTQLKSGDGASEHVKQYRKQFPEDLAPMPNYDFTKLVEVITQSTEADIEAQLRHETRETEIYKAITQFREYFQPGRVKEGFHFNHKNLINASITYNGQFVNWSEEQLELFWQQVIGYIQRSFPACDAQAYCQGLFGITEKSEPLRRSLEYKNDTGNHFFPLSSDLGFERAVGTMGGPSFGGPFPDDCLRSISIKETYVARKHKALGNLAVPTSSKNLLSL